MNKLIKDKRGFTLIEIIVAMAITTIIVGTISAMIIFAHKSYYNVENTNSVLNGVNAVTEMVREYTFDAEEAEIMDVTSIPTVDPEYMSICCIDNTVYVDGNVYETAKGMGGETLILQFSADSGSKLLKYKLDVFDENNNPLIESQDLSAYLNSCDENIKGVATGNCIVIKR